jgi:NAD(P)-dependent dehydrogenase (short-subunit alcohol dehydrogenase family)
MIIVGGTAGVGRALAAHYPAQGRSVVVAGRDAQLARAVAAELDAATSPGGSAGPARGRVRGVAADLRRPESLADAFAAVEKV